MAEQEDWEEDDNYFIGICDQCGGKKKVVRSADPFFNEGLTDDDTEENWCFECYSERADDI
jgi:hypothetical protein